MSAGMLSRFLRTMTGHRNKENAEKPYPRKGYPNSILLKAVKQDILSGKTATIRLYGVSMRPFLEDKRDKALLAPVKIEDLRVNDAVLAEVQPDFYVLHRIIRMDGNRLTLMGDGNVDSTEHCLAEQVVARAEAFYRKGRTVPDSTSSFKWKCYSCIWTHLRCVRRYLLFIHRLCFIRTR